jgi:hypothetical protein
LTHGKETPEDDRDEHEVEEQKKICCRVYKPVMRSAMINELCADYGYERKYAIKLLGRALPLPSGRKKPGPRGKVKQPLAVALRNQR